MTKTNCTDKTFFMRASVALSNMAVTMMSRGCHEQALDTLRDGLSIIKRINPALLRQTTTNDRTTAGLDHEEPLATARLKLANPRVLRNSQRRSVRVTSLLETARFFCAGQRDPLVTMRADEVIALRLDSDSVHCLDFITSAMLYNYSVVHFQLSDAQRTKSSRHSRMLLETGTKLLKFSKHFLTPLVTATKDDHDKLTGVLFLMSLVLQMQISGGLEMEQRHAAPRGRIAKQQWCEQHDQLISSYKKALCHVHETAQDLSRGFPCCLGGVEFAPAA